MTSPPGSEADRWWQELADESPVAREVLAHDWAATSIGAPSTWSTSLRAAVRTCLTTRFPVLVAWGPDLVMIYNDSYRTMLGQDLHPWALGRPMREVWSEIWDVIGPLAESVMTTGAPTWAQDQRLDMERNGFLEETYFTYSYSPIIDDDGTIGGLLDICTETTSQVVTQRRLACLGALGTATMGAVDPVDLCRRAAVVLGRSRDDVCWADVHLLVDGQLSLVASNRSPRDAMAAATALRLAGAAASGTTQHHVSATGGDVVAIPLGGVSTVGVLVVALNSARPYDDGYANFVNLCAQSVGTALEFATNRLVEVERLREVNEVLQHAMLPPVSDTDTVAARYVPADGQLSVGGDWYDHVELGDGRHAFVVGDCVGHGLDAAAVMGQLRSAARALLLDGLGPAAVLEAIDRFAPSVGGECATMACAIVDQTTHAVTHASAGHPPILVVGPDGTSWLSAARGRPISVSPGPRVETVSTVEQDALLVLYSDGLIERREESIDVGLQRLADIAFGLRALPVPQLAGQLLVALEPPERRDDMVVLVARATSDVAEPVDAAVDGG